MTKERRLPPTMNHLKGASYLSHLKERQDKAKEEKQMKASEKASRVDSVIADIEVGPVSNIDEDKDGSKVPAVDMEPDIVKKKRKKNTTKKCQATSEITVNPVLPGTTTPSVAVVRQKSISVVPAVPPERKRSGSDKVPNATDKSFCNHYCVRDLINTPCCYLTKRQNDHYAGKGNFLYGVSCKECDTPAVQVKKQANAMLGNVAFMCEMGQKAFVVHADERHLPYYTDRECTGSYLCYKCAIRMVQEVEESAGGAGVRSSGRHRRSLK